MESFSCAHMTRIILCQNARQNSIPKAINAVSCIEYHSMLNESWIVQLPRELCNACKNGHTNHVISTHDLTHLWCLCPRPNTLSMLHRLRNVCMDRAARARADDNAPHEANHTPSPRHRLGQKPVSPSWYSFLWVCVRARACISSPVGVARGALLSLFLFVVFCFCRWSNRCAF